MSPSHQERVLVDPALAVTIIDPPSESSPRSGRRELGQVERDVGDRIDTRARGIITDLDLVAGRDRARAR